MNRQIIASACIFFALIPAVASAQAVESDPDFTFKHPGRTLVVFNIERVKWIVDQRFKDGDFTARQAHAINLEADGIRGEEELFSSRHGGHLTIAEENKLNAQVSQLLRQINT